MTLMPKWAAETQLDDQFVPRGDVDAEPQRNLSVTRSSQISLSRCSGPKKKRHFVSYLLAPESNESCCRVTQTVRAVGRDHTHSHTHLHTPTHTLVGVRARYNTKRKMANIGQQFNCLSSQFIFLLNIF